MLAWCGAWKLGRYTDILHSAAVAVSVAPIRWSSGQMLQ